MMIKQMLMMITHDDNDNTYSCYSFSTPLYMQDSFRLDNVHDDMDDKQDDGGDDKTLFQSAE